MLGKYKFKEVHFRWAGIFILAAVMTMVMKQEHQTFLGKYPTSLFFTAFYWNGAFMMFMAFRRRYPQIRQTPKRLIITLFCLVIFLVVGETALCLLLEFKSFDDFVNHPILFFDHIPIIFVASAVVGSIYENIYFFQQWRDSIKLNEALKNQQIRTQFEVLQNQMSPHFLFNSLNTLTTLIAEDGDIAIEFTEKLSEVYRYILMNKERELVTLEEELVFAKNYIFLLKIRYPENLKTQFEIEDKHLDQSIAPLTIQILLENAIKHNVVSKTNPLTIRIYVDHNNNVVVKNNLKKKKVIEKSTKTGLANIEKRYAYFGQREIQIDKSDKEFSVSVPLLHIKNEKLMEPAV